MKIGLQELIVVFIVALIVLGPDKMPYYAKKLGQAVAQFKKYTSDATKDIRENIVEPLQEAQRPLKEAMEPITELNKEIKGNVKDIKKSFVNIEKPKKENEQKASGQKAEESAETAQEQTGADIEEEKADPAPDAEVREEKESAAAQETVPL